MKKPTKKSTTIAMDSDGLSGKERTTEVKAIVDDIRELLQEPVARDFGQKDRSRLRVYGDYNVRLAT